MPQQEQQLQERQLQQLQQQQQHNIANQFAHVYGVPSAAAAAPAYGSNRPILEVSQPAGPGVCRCCLCLNRPSRVVREPSCMLVCLCFLLLCCLGCVHSCMLVPVGTCLYGCCVREAALHARVHYPSLRVCRCSCVLNSVVVAPNASCAGDWAGELHRRSHGRRLQLGVPTLLRRGATAATAGPLGALVSRLAAASEQWLRESWWVKHLWDCWACAAFNRILA